MNHTFYFLVFYEPPFAARILPLDGKTFFEDITGIDCYTLLYTKEQFLKNFFSLGVSLDPNELFIARIDSSGNVSVYDCFFRIGLEVPFYQKIDYSMFQFALERQRKVQNHENIVLDKSETFMKYTSMLINHITSNSSRQLAVTSDSSLKPIELKARIRSISTVKDFTRTLPKIQKFLIHYKTLRGLTLECLDYTFSDILSSDRESRRQFIYRHFVLEKKIHMKREEDIRWNR